MKTVSVLLRTVDRTGNVLGTDVGLYEEQTLWASVQSTVEALQKRFPTAVRVIVDLAL